MRKWDIVPRGPSVPEPLQPLRTTCAAHGDTCALFAIRSGRQTANKKQRLYVPAIFSSVAKVGIILNQLRTDVQNYFFIKTVDGNKILYFWHAMKFRLRNTIVNSVASRNPFWILVLITLLISCKKEEVVPDPPAPRVMEVWLHRVNTIDKAIFYRDAYTGYELDVHFDTTTGTYLVKHDFADTTILPFSTWLAAIEKPEELGYWLDFKNLSYEFRMEALAELLRIRNAFNLKKYPIVVEASNPTCLPPFDTLNFVPSFYIPTFDPALLTPEEELAYKEYIAGYLNETGVQTISGYSFQHMFMQTWFPSMNKLLWYLDSVDPAIKDSVIAETRKDLTVEVLLVGEYYP